MHKEHGLYFRKYSRRKTLLTRVNCLQFKQLTLDIILKAIAFRNFKSIIFKKHIAVCVLK